MNEAKELEAKLTDAIEVSQPALQIIGLGKLFEEMLTTEEAKKAYGRKAYNTVYEWWVEDESGEVLYPLNADEQSTTYDKEIQANKPKRTRHSALSIYVGLMVEKKYKDKHKRKDREYTQQLADLYQQLLEKKWIVPVIYDNSPFKFTLTPYSEERDAFVRVYEVASRRIARVDRWTLLSEEIRSNKRSINENDGGTRIQSSNDRPIPIEPTERLIQLRKEFSEEEIDNLTYREIYQMYLFPTQAFLEEVQKISSVEQRKSYYGHLDAYNEVLGDLWCTGEGQLPRKIIKEI